MKGMKMNLQEKIDLFDETIEMIRNKIFSEADRHYDTIILPKEYNGDVMAAYIARGWCDEEVKLIEKLTKLRDEYEMENETPE
jgi:hypothetical protein